jgi:hypothetical protein
VPQPLTKEQYNAAISKGYTQEQIIAFERKRLGTASAVSPQIQPQIKPQTPAGMVESGATFSPKSGLSVRYAPAMNKGYTDAAAQKLSQADAMKADLEQLRTIITKDQTDYKEGKNLGGLASAQFLGMKPQVYLSEKGQEYRLLRDSMSNRLLYLRSGAQINEKEYKRLSGLLSQWWRSDKLDLDQLNRLESEFVGIADKIRFGREGENKTPIKTPATEKKYVRTGTRNGTKVGMLADGTVEVINGK